MQSQNRFFDDLARVAGGAFGTVAQLRNEIEMLVRQRIERVLADMDVVPRDEFEVVQAVAVEARRGQEALEERVKALEARLEALESQAKPAAAQRESGASKKPAARSGGTAKSREKAGGGSKPGDASGSDSGAGS